MSAYAEWTRVFDPRPGARVRLVCFPHAGGSAAAFGQWHRLLPDNVEVVAVQYPGRADRFDEPLEPDLDALADRLAAALGPAVDHSTVFFGHSLGATVAFEVASRLRPRFPAPLARLVVSARRGPSVPERGAPEELDGRTVRARVRELGGRGAELLADPEVLDLALPVLRNDFAMARAHRTRPGPPLACPITAVAADGDPAVDAADVARWRAHTLGGFELLRVPGGHFYLEDGAADLLARLGLGARARR
ncbi:alpha/beta fold hydrolase [Actinokineospora sp. PR83]|uniref:thioesterase II family protein n=1 Tax=Actinokineospora sp. PR83 TaxID=2884908 RepID=UPI0027E08529|nr:alpha/beta fold hydrolase [Actinokineospora sp. PR83]MCG8914452.1 alpha/beta fold hydrolase [Actinokineospora sp. PR83]